MTLNIPHKIRVALYIFTALSAPIMSYFLNKGFIGDLEMNLYLAEVTVVSTMAALNTRPNGKE